MTPDAPPDARSPPGATRTGAAPTRGARRRAARSGAVASGAVASGAVASAALALAALTACGPAPGAAVSARAGPSAALGLPHDGLLRAGRALPDRGPGFERARPGESTRFGTPELVAALERAAAVVAARFPGSPPLRIGDLSAPLGGRHPRHRSHRTGRDADVLYFAVDEHGVPVPGAGFFAYDRFGVARDARPRGAAAAARPGDAKTGLSFLDEARTWLLLRTLIAADDVPVQWIFCSAGIKQRLLAYAATVEPDPEVLLRASYVLHQPTTGRPHDDHFHVRIACTAAMRALGCADDGPVWPWQRRDHERAAPPEPQPRGSGASAAATAPEAPDVLDDRTLLGWLLEDLDPDPRASDTSVASAR